MISLAEAHAWLTAHMRQRAPEYVPRSAAANRILATDTPLVPRPTHTTALIDGLAIRAAATEGATDYAPIPVQGTPVRAGDAMPPGTDAVLPNPDADTLAAMAPGHGVAPAGYDIPSGAILPARTLLTPLHLALLHTDPLVLSRPHIGTEASLLHALITAQGATVANDDPDLILTTDPLATTDAEAIATRPGETTALGHLGGTPAIRLPHFPAAQATVFAILVAPILRHLAARPEPAFIEAALTRKITSQLGQLDAVRVRVAAGAATPLGPADGIGLLAATEATGLVLVAEGSEGYPAGATVPIYPL